MGETLTRWVPKAGFGALVTAAFAVPLVFTRRTGDAFGIPKATVLWLCLVVAVAGAATTWLATRRAPVPRLAVLAPLGVLVGWTALATATSLAPAISALGSYGRYDGLAGTAGGALLLLLVVAATWREPARLEVLAVAVLASGAVALAYVGLQQVGLDPVTWYNAGVAITTTGLLGNPNFSGAHLAMCVPFAILASTRVQPLPAKAALWALAVGLAGGVAATSTRGGILALFGSVAVAGLLVPDLVPRIVRWGALALTVVAALVVVLAVTTEALPTRTTVGRARILQASSLRERFDIWAGAVEVIADRPLVGTGPDAFGLAYPYVRPPRPGGQASISADEVHNVYLDRAATAGLPALAAYGWLVVVVGTSAWRRRDRVPPDQRWLLGAFGGGAAGYLFQGVFSIDVVALAAFSWTAMGALVALTDRAVVARREGGEPLPTARPLPLGAFVVLGAGVVLVASQVVRPFVADVRYRDALEARRRGEPAGVVAGDLTAAASWLDLEPRYRTATADLLEQMAMVETQDPVLRARLLEEAVLGYDQSLERGPGDVNVLLGKARALERLGRVDPARRDEAFAEAEEIYDDLFDELRALDVVRMPYARFLETRSTLGSGDAAERDRDAAIEQFEEASRIDATAVAARRNLARLAVADGRLEEALEYLELAVLGSPSDQQLIEARDEVQRQLGE